MHREQKSKAACSAINFLKVQLIMQLKMILVNHRINRINETSQFSQFVYRCYCLAARHLKKFQTDCDETLWRDVPCANEELID